jgi:hypothetical protein
MTTNSEIELILSTVALLFEPSENRQPIELTQEVFETFLRKPLQISVLSGNRIFASSNRDQIEVQVYSNKLDVRDANGDIQHGIDNIPRILRDAATLWPEEENVKSCGINFVVDVYLENPKAWLGNHLLNQALITDVGSAISSNLVSLMFKQDQRDWTIRFQEQQGKRLNINFNASQTITNLPSQKDLQIDINTQYCAFRDFLAQLGLLRNKS